MSQPTVLLLSGPNLNLLGEREPEVYGTASLADHVARAEAAASEVGLTLRHLQSDSESELVAAVHDARSSTSGIVINGGAFTHYSWALHDALAACAQPVIELHLSNPGAREDFRHTSVLTPVSTAVIAGLGGAGYPLAVRAMAGLLGTLPP